MLAFPGTGAPFEVAAVVAPVALYFLVLGLVNSRPNPQLLSGRLDFAILTIAICPLFVLPLLGYFGVSALSLAATAAILAVGAAVLAPRGRMWVIYNMQAEQARRAVASALRRMGVAFEARPDGCALPDIQARVQVGGFSPLRNVTIRLHGADKALAGRFEQALGQVLRSHEAQTSPMAVSLLLIATAMLVAPLAMMAHRVPEVVRLLTGLLH